MKIESYFTKIPNNFFYDLSDEGWLSLKSDTIVSQYQGYGGCIITYYKILDLNNLKKVFKKPIFTILPDFVRLTTVTGAQCGLPPHIDHNVSVSLNYYINASDIDNTIFYIPKPGEKPYDYNTVATNKYNPVKDQENIYKFTQVEEVTRFSAANHSAFLLNVSKIHSVDKVSALPRIFLTFLWKEKSYDEILNSLKG